MTEKEYNKLCGKLAAGGPLTEREASDFISIIEQFESMLDDADQDDYFGTEGWRYNMGWS